MEKFESLKEALLNNHTFPTDYMFKFVVPNTPAKEAELITLFAGSEIKKRLSKSGKYLSVTAVVNVQSADEVILFYQKASTIEGVISL
jgi:hypothetical protein